MTIARSRVHNNTLVGINVTSDSSSISNNFIYRNGARVTGRGDGGVIIRTDGGAHTFVFNTVVANRVETPGVPAGLACTGTTTVDAANNLFWNNVAVDTLSDAGAGCDVTYSYGDNLPTEQNNLSFAVDGDPLFIDPSADDFHIRPESPCVDAGDPIRAGDFDIDGDNRPIGPRSDCGADESPQP